MLCRGVHLYGPAFLLSVALLAPAANAQHMWDQVHTDPYGRIVISTPTLGQALGFAPQRGVQPIVAQSVPVPQTLGLRWAASEQDHRVVAGHTVQITAQGNGHQVVVDGRVLANDTEDDRVVIQSVHQGGGRTYVLIGEQSGGTACPSMYQAVDLSGIPVISPQFGSCSDLPRVSVVGGALRVSVPAFRAAPAATYMFRDGHLQR